MPCVLKSNVFVPRINVKQPSAVSPSTYLPRVPIHALLRQRPMDLTGGTSYLLAILGETPLVR